MEGGDDKLLTQEGGRGKSSNIKEPGGAGKSDRLSGRRRGQGEGREGWYLTRLEGAVRYGRQSGPLHVIKRRRPYKVSH